VNNAMPRVQIWIFAKLFDRAQLVLPKSGVHKRGALRCDTCLPVTQSCFQWLFECAVDVCRRRRAPRIFPKLEKASSRTRPITVAMLRSLARYDTFAKAKAHVQTRSAVGGALTVAALLLGAALFVGEVANFARVRVEDHLAIDRTPGERVRCRARGGVTVLDLAAAVAVLATCHRLLRTSRPVVCLCVSSPARPLR
jgi:hypothetical protein